MGKGLIKVITVMSLQIALATQQQAFDQASSEYKSMNTSTLQTKNLSSKVRTNDYHQGDVNAVSAKGYYEDESAMDAAKQTHFANNTEAQAVHQASNMNKHEIDPNNPAYKKAIGHQTNAEHILSDEGERYDCQHIYQDGGKTIYTEKCQVSNILPMQCSRYPVVNTYSVDNYVKSTVGLHSGNFKIQDSRNAKVYVNSAGDVTALRLYISKPRHMGEPCGDVFKSYINGTYVGMTHVRCDYHARSDVQINLSGFRVKYAPNSYFNFQLSGSGRGFADWRPFSGSATILVNHPIKKANQP